MTDLLDSVNQQYPIGSLLVWETDRTIATLDRLGPFKFPKTKGPVGYLLDGHQRLSTLAGALTSRDEHAEIEDQSDPGRWQLAYDLESGRFQHRSASQTSDRPLFPLPALLDTRRFFDEVDKLREVYPPPLAREYTDQVTVLARSFQSYRVPVIRIRQTEPSEAVEIFARLNSKGQVMSADQMVSALMYRDPADPDPFDLTEAITSIAEQGAALGFVDIDRTTILRAVLANLDVDIYRTDWTQLTTQRRELLRPQMSAATQRSGESLDRAIRFLRDVADIRTGRLLPYTMQLVVLSAFFDVAEHPTDAQMRLLERWFWVSSFAGWFGSSNPSRVNSLVIEVRNRIARDPHPTSFENFDIGVEALPYPTSFDMRSARTRALLCVTLSLGPSWTPAQGIESPWALIAERGPGAIGHILGNPPKHLSGNPANRMIRPPGEERGSLRGWIERMVDRAEWGILESYAVPRNAALALSGNDPDSFVALRAAYLQEAEARFQDRHGVTRSNRAPAIAPIDTD